MRGHNVCFHKEMRKIISELSLLLLLIWSSVTSMNVKEERYCTTPVGVSVNV